MTRPKPMELEQVLQTARLSTFMPKPSLIGYIDQAAGLFVEAILPDAAIGDIYTIINNNHEIIAEVVGVQQQRARLLPYQNSPGLQSGLPLRKTNKTQHIAVGSALLGRSIDAFGKPLDNKPTPFCSHLQPLYRQPAPLTTRAPIDQQLHTGIRVVDALLPLGYGQRIGIFAEAGIGKTTLLTWLCRHTKVDVVVLGLIGERNREAAQLLAADQPYLNERCVMVIATSDTSPPERVRAAFAAHAVAEYFCEQGQKVLLVVDSLTRLCMAQREIGLALGEPPTSKGYPPSAFAILPKLLERTGNFNNNGSISAIYSILVESDQASDPVAHNLRGLLDGHMVLSRVLAERSHYPAIDVLQSLSRLENTLLKPDVLGHTRQLRSYLAILEDNKDLLAIGAYQSGSLPELDQALSKRADINRFLRQNEGDYFTLPAIFAHLALLVRPS